MQRTLSSSNLAFNISAIGTMATSAVSSLSSSSSSESFPKLSSALMRRISLHPYRTAGREILTSAMGSFHSSTWKLRERIALPRRWKFSSPNIVSWCSSGNKSGLA